MSEKLTIKKPSKEKKLTQSKVEAVKRTAPLNEKSKKRDPKKIGQPTKEEIYKQNQKVTIYLNEAQIGILEQKAIQGGYTPKDKAKWLKRIVIAPEAELLESAGLHEEIAILNEELRSCQAMLKQKDEEIAILNEKLRSCQAMSEQKDEMIELLKGK